MLYSLGGVAGATGSGQSYGVAAAHSNGPLSLAAGYYHLSNGNAANRGTTTWDLLFDTSLNAVDATAFAIKNVRVGANYLVESVTLGRYYSHAEYTADGRSAFANTQKYEPARCMPCGRCRRRFRCRLATCT